MIRNDEMVCGYWLDGVDGYWATFYKRDRIPTDHEHGGGYDYEHIVAAYGSAQEAQAAADAHNAALSKSGAA